MAATQSPDRRDVSSEGGHNGAKTPHTRLLDLMAGWADFAQRDSVTDTSGTVDEICALYQDAGNLDVGVDSAADPKTEESIRRFLVEQVLPVLLRH